MLTPACAAVPPTMQVRALETQLRAAGSPIVESPAAGLGATDPSSPSAARAPPALSGHPSFAFQNGAGSSSGNAHPHIVTGGVASPSHSSVGDDGSPVRTVHVTGAGGGAGADDSLLDAASALDSTGGSLGSTGASVSPGGAGGGGGGARSRPQTAMSRTAQTSQDKFVAKVRGGAHVQAWRKKLHAIPTLTSPHTLLPGWQELVQAAARAQTGSLGVYREL